MTLPPEVMAALAGRSPNAHATLNCSIDGPIGETLIVAAEGQLFVFSRQSMIGSYEPVELETANPPKLERGDFSDTLHVNLADGTPHELSVSSFERDAVTAVLEAAPTMASAGGSAQDESAEETAHDSPPESTLASTQETPDADPPFEQPPPVSTADDGSASSNPPVPKPETRAPSTRRPSHRLPELEPDESKHDDGPRQDIYHSRHPGTLGCWLQFILFVGGVVAFWFLHVLAYENAAEYLRWEVDTDSASFVLTKIVAMIAGVYVGAKLTGIINWLSDRGNWGGYLEFRGMDAIFNGPKGAWKEIIDLSKPFDVECQWHCTSKDAKPDDKKSHHVTVIFRQGESAAALGGILFAKQVNFNVTGMTYTQVEKQPTFPHAFTLEQKTLRKVVTRIMKD
ncbi:MAG: hypothetical protein R3E76_00660 [Planctomycetota bacterium]